MVAAETTLVAAFADHGHPFAKVADRRVEIDKAAHTMDVTYRLDPGPTLDLRSTPGRSERGDAGG